MIAAVILFDGRLQKRKHLLRARQIHRVLVDLHGIGAVQGFLDAAPQSSQHIGNYDTLVIYGAPEHLLSFPAQLALREHHLITARRKGLSRLDQTCVHLRNIPHHAHPRSVQVHRKVVVPVAFKGLQTRQEKSGGNARKHRNLNICNFHFFIMSAQYFHGNKKDKIRLSFQRSVIAYP